MGKNPYLLLDQSLKTGISGYDRVQTNTGHLLAGGQSVFGWTFTNCTGTVVALPDTTLPLQSGPNCIQVTTAASDEATLKIGNDFSAVDGLCLAFYWPHADGTTFTITIADDAAFTNYHQWKCYAVQGWNFFRPSRGYTTAANSMTYSTCRRFKIQCSTASKTYYIAWLRMGMQFKPQIMVGADDEYLNVSTVLRPLMDAYGFKGYVAFAKYFEARSASYMTLAQVQAMQDTYGWDVINHTRDHVDHNASGNGDPLETIVDDYKWNRDYMKANGLKGADIVAYPFGGGVQGVNNTLEIAMKQIGCRMARSVRKGFMDATSGQPTWDTPLSIATNPYKCRIINPYTSTTYRSAATVLGDIDQVIACGGIAWFMGHGCPSAAAGDPGDSSGLTWNSGDYDLMLAGLKKRSDAGMVDVVTPSQLLNKIGAVPEIRTTAAAISYSAMPQKHCIIDADNSTNYTDAGTTPAVVGDLVYRATDVTGNGRYAEQSTSNKRPTLRTGTNGGKTFNYYEFAGAATGMPTAAWSALSGPFHIVVVSQFATLAAGNQYSIGGIATGNRADILQQGGSSNVWSAFAGTALISQTGIAADTAWHLCEFVSNGNNSRLVIDGVEYVDNSGTNTLTGIMLANKFDYSGGGNTNIAYAGVFASVDHAITQYMLGHRAYLSNRYGITLVQPPYVYNV